MFSDLKGIWTTEIQENRDAHSLHFGSLAFVVGYVVYLAKVPPYTRDMCLQHLWPQCLRSCGVHLTWPKIAINGINFLSSPPAASPNSQHQLNEGDEEEALPCMESTVDRMYLSMATHLMEVSEVLLLLEEGWTGREILDYLVISTSWRQSVMIIDPEEVALKWMTRLHGTEMISMDARQVDREFLHSLEVALTTGQPTHIHHIGPEIDPVLMAIVEFSEIASGNAGKNVQIFPLLFFSEDYSCHPCLSMLTSIILGLFYLRTYIHVYCISLCSPKLQLTWKYFCVHLT